MKWHTEKRKVSELVPSNNNPRTLNEKQFKDLERSLKKFNLVEIPVINIGNRVLAGHQRLKVLTLLGRTEEEIDVRVPDRALSEKECDEYMIRSNKNTAEWDYEVLTDEFKGEELVEYGFEAWEIGLNLNIEATQTESTEETEKREAPKGKKQHKCPECGCEFIP